MFELGERLRNGQISQEGLELAAFVGHQPAVDLLDLMGKKFEAPPTDPEQWLRAIQRWPDAKPRALIASAHARIAEAEKTVATEGGITAEMIKDWRDLLGKIEDYFVSKDTNLGLELSEAGHKLDEGIGCLAQMAAEGAMVGAQLSDSRQRTLAIDLELEKILILLQVTFHAEHSLGFPFPNMTGVRQEIVPWILDGKDSLRERVEARRIQKGQGYTRGDVADGLR